MLQFGDNKRALKCFQTRIVGNRGENRSEAC